MSEFEKGDCDEGNLFCPPVLGSDRLQVELHLGADGGNRAVDEAVFRQEKSETSIFLSRQDPSENVLVI